MHRSVGDNPLRKDAERDDRIYGEAPVDLHRTLTGDGPLFHLSTHDPGAAGAQLLVEMAHWSPTGDEVAVTMDGAALGAPEVRNHVAENPGKTPPTWTRTAGWSGTSTRRRPPPVSTRSRLSWSSGIRGSGPPLTVANVEIWTSFD